MTVQSRTEHMPDDPFAASPFPVGVLESARRHKLLALAPVIVLLAGALAWGLQRSPVYSAEARLVVGGIDLSQPGALNALPTASETLAGNYSRLATSDALVETIARDLRVPTATVRGHVEASPVPNSGVVRIAATGSSASDAATIANAASEALRRRVAETSSSREEVQRAYQAYSRAAAATESARLNADRVSGTAGPAPSSERRQELVRARTQLELSQVRTGVLRDEYRRVRQRSASVPRLQALSKAAFASDDRISRLQLAVFAAVAAGILIGLAMATLRENAIVRRRYAA